MASDKSAGPGANKQRRSSHGCPGTGVARGRPPHGHTPGKVCPAAGGHVSKLGRWIFLSSHHLLSRGLERKKEKEVCVWGGNKNKNTPAISSKSDKMRKR